MWCHPSMVACFRLPITTLRGIQGVIRAIPNVADLHIGCTVVSWSHNRCHRLTRMRKTGGPKEAQQAATRLITPLEPHRHTEYKELPKGYMLGRDCPDRKTLGTCLQSEGTRLTGTHTTDTCPVRGLRPHMGSKDQVPIHPQARVPCMRLHTPRRLLHLPPLPGLSHLRDSNLPGLSRLLASLAHRRTATRMHLPTSHHQQAKDSSPQSVTVACIALIHGSSEAYVADSANALAGIPPWSAALRLS